MGKACAQRMAARRARSGLALLLASVVAAGLLAPSVASRPQAKAGKLTGAERRALSIVSVDASAAEPAGILVTATFGGNIEQKLGRDGLRKGLVAVILHPKDPASETAGVATVGAGAIGRTLSRTSSSDVGVVRDGRRLSFFVGGPGSSSFESVEVKAFARAPAGGAAGSVASAPPVTAEFWDEIDASTAGDEASTDLLDALATPAPCSELRVLRDTVVNRLDKVRHRKRQLNELGKKIDAAIVEAEDEVDLGSKLAAGTLHSFGAPFGLIFTVLLGVTPEQDFDSWKAVLRSLKLDRHLVDAHSKRNQDLIERLSELKGKFEGLLANCTEPPSQAEEPLGISPINAQFFSADRATLYTVLINDQQPDTTISYQWTLSLEAVDPNEGVDYDCVNERYGGFSSTASEFRWAHGNKGDPVQDDRCDHSLEGQYGHQGLITVEVSDSRGWKCTATYKGTKTSGEVADAASTPTCTPPGS